MPAFRDRVGLTRPSRLDFQPGMGIARAKPTQPKRTTCPHDRWWQSSLR